MEKMDRGILIVDDLQFIRISIKEILEKNSFVVVGEAENGIEALEFFEKYKPDIMLLDITMPILSGLDALKILKSKYPQAKVIMCSAMGQQKYIIRAIQLGARDFVIKPFKAERLLSSIRKTMEM